MILSAVFAALVAVPAAGERWTDEDVAAAQAELDALCRAMQPFMERPDKFKGLKIERDEAINAFADMKGNVTFFTGMLDFLNSEDEAAAVCGHEMAHLAAQHIKRSMGRRIGGVILDIIVDRNVGDLAGDLVGGAFVNKQSRSHEREADRRGLNYMWNAGFDPRVSWKLWEAMAEASEGEPLLAKYLSTHPVHSERIENFKVLTYKWCLENPARKYCNEIRGDAELRAAYENFE
ncbi:MAG: M48 family metallopeptidase [bacterium]